MKKIHTIYSTGDVVNQKRQISNIIVEVIPLVLNNGSDCSLDID